jgi:EAL domain-containing protein (putative c-di-GMP-specific phosphodiesterase class I)/CheY-like chemotaxis protein
MKARRMSKSSSPNQDMPTLPPELDDEDRERHNDTPAAILVIDDDEQLREGYRRVLTQAGFGTLAVPSAKLALELLRSGDLFDVIVSDILMPDMDGVTMLREVRKYNLDVPVILVTGNPSLETAIAAMQFGGFRYLQKPVEPEDLIKVVREAIPRHRLARLKREALLLLSSTREQLGDRASLEVYFEQALERLWIAFQPIVTWRNRRVFAYEALVRSAESRLSSPLLLLDAAERLGRMHDLGRRIRRLVAEQIRRAPQDAWIFVNLHGLDLQDPDLSNQQSALSEHANRVVLEVTERYSLDRIQDVAGKIAQLRAIGYRVAVDDLGAGYAGLSSFSSLEPDFVKLDMSLVRDIGSSKRKQSLVRSMIAVCSRELGMEVVCEGVETIAERDTLESLGADQMQGYHFGRPVPDFESVIFDESVGEG